MLSSAMEWAAAVLAVGLAAGMVLLLMAGPTEVR